MPDGTVAYVLKGFPRRSETFVASELYRLEQLGLDVRLFAIKQDEVYRHPVVDRIRAAPEYLPRTTSLSRNTSLVGWIRANLPTFSPALRRVACRRPLGFARAMAAAAAQSLRARRHFWSRPRGVYVKELLLSVALADRILGAPDVRHLHAHFAHGATTVAWLAATIAGLPFSFTAHATDIYRESVNPAGLLHRKLRAARFAVTCTEANRAFLRARAGSTPVHRLYHGLNVDFCELLASAGPRAARSDDGCLRILSVGRLVPKKGFLTLVDACAILQRRGIAFECIIVGETGDDDAPALNAVPPLSDSPGNEVAPALSARRALPGSPGDADSTARSAMRPLSTSPVLAEAPALGAVRLLAGGPGDENAPNLGAARALPGSPGAKRHHADEVRQRIAALGLESRVRLAGAMSQAALFEAYRQSSVLCLPCRVVEDGDRDGIPNVLAEAMACGLPVVTTAVSGIPGLLVDDDANGLFVPPDQPDAVADALQRLCVEPLLAVALGRAAQASVRQRFDADASAQRLRQLFRVEALA